MPVRNRLAELQPEIAAWRRDIHAHPELLFETVRTGRLVAERLRAFGCDAVVEGMAQTGVVGVIRGRSTASGRVIGLRADMDALPITEETGLAHASTVPGRMHACGHDGHTAMLLGAARYLAETRNFDGTAVVIFQPAEEGGGGAKVMCDEGLMERFGIQEVYGMHNRPGLPVGQFAIRTGPFLAATDKFDIAVIGRGGHAAQPHDTVDPTVIAAHMVLALQSIASRNIDPTRPVVVSVTALRTESDAYNVIPERAFLRGTIRSQDAETREIAVRRVREIAEATAAAFGGRAEVTDIAGYPVTVNSPDQTAFAAAVARDVAGSVDTKHDLIMGAEDFAFMLQERPGAYILIGNGDSAEVHHPRYEFNDDAIPAGCSWYAGLVEGRMPAA